MVDRLDMEKATKDAIDRMSGNGYAITKLRCGPAELIDKPTDESKRYMLIEFSDVYEEKKAEVSDENDPPRAPAS